MDKIAVIVYGDGGELGNFKIFADGLKKEMELKYTKVIVQYINRDSKFFSLIKSIDEAKEEIAELHVFSHAIGAGLFLGYKDPIVSTSRSNAITHAAKLKRKVSYIEAVKTEVGAIQTDDLIIGSLAKDKADYQKKFAIDGLIKLWGCNSGVNRWVYSDYGVTSPTDTSTVYYWRAFNELNIPKPSIAQALADFFNRKVYGANSGASIEVQYKKKWISTQTYKNSAGHWPSGNLPHRLVPDQGVYNEYTP